MSTQHKARSIAEQLLWLGFFALVTVIVSYRWASAVSTKDYGVSVTLPSSTKGSVQFEAYSLKQRQAGTYLEVTGIDQARLIPAMTRLSNPGWARVSVNNKTFESTSCVPYPVSGFAAVCNLSAVELTAGKNQVLVSFDFEQKLPAGIKVKFMVDPPIMNMAYSEGYWLLAGEPFINPFLACLAVLLLVAALKIHSIRRWLSFVF